MVVQKEIENLNFSILLEKKLVLRGAKRLIEEIHS